MNTSVTETDDDNRPYKRLSAEIFKQKAFYGNEVSQGLDSNASNLASELPEQYDMPFEYFVMLFAESMALDGMYSFSLPHKIKERIKGIFETNLVSFWTLPFTPEQSLLVVKRLSNRILEELTALSQELSSYRQNGRAIFTQLEIDVITEVIGKIGVKFSDYIEQFEAIFNRTTRNTLEEEFVLICTQIIREQHSRGREWAFKFSEFNESYTAKLFFEHDKIDYQLRFVQNNSKSSSVITIDTRFNTNYRYIVFSFSPRDFFGNRFLFLVFAFFHEYISHLNACMHSYEQDFKDKIDISSFNLIPIELSEGWMVHAAQKFFEDNGDSLLSAEYSHLEIDIRTNLERRMLSQIDSDSQTYLPRVNRGYNLGDQFLKLLERQICNKDYMRASKLYFRFSFDLITRYPPYPSWHRDFIDTMELFLHSQKDRLIEIIKLGLQQHNGLEYIDLELVWDQIKDQHPQVTLSVY